MDLFMSFGDVLWDLSIAMTSIIFVKIALYERIKGKKAFFLYVTICVIYLLADYLIFIWSRNESWSMMYFTAYVMELSAIFFAGYMAEGDLWRNFTFLALVQITVGLLLGVVALFSKSINAVLYYDGVYRLKNNPVIYYLYISVLQILFGVVVSLCLKPFIRRLTKINNIIYKFFFVFYSLYGFINCVIRVKNYSNKKFLALYVVVFLQFLGVITCVYLMVYLYNKSVRRNIEKELERLDINNEKFAVQYRKVAEENRKLSEIKADVNNYINEIKTSENLMLNAYAAAFNESNKDICMSTNPIVGSLLIDSIISELDDILEEKNTVLEVTIGRNCDGLIIEYENEIAFVIKTVINISDMLKESSYVVIGIRNVASRLFVSVNMICKAKLYSNGAISRMMNYIRLQKGYCIVKNSGNKALINVLL